MSMMKGVYMRRSWMSILVHIPYALRRPAIANVIPPSMKVPASINLNEISSSSNITPPHAANTGTESCTIAAAWQSDRAKPHTRSHILLLKRLLPKGQPIESRIEIVEVIQCHQSNCDNERHCTDKVARRSFKR